MDSASAQWVRRYVAPAGPAEVTHDGPWAVVSRVPVRGGQVWFKNCAAVQAFEPPPDGRPR
ncbi:MAG: hypothetical protein M3042_03425 [Actinomycetota bacterium]|nr:hypothetical protein [Actinomycetota bacterium]